MSARDITYSAVIRVSSYEREGSGGVPTNFNCEQIAAAAADTVWPGGASSGGGRPEETHFYSWHADPLNGEVCAKSWPTSKRVGGPDGKTSCVTSL